MHAHIYTRTRDPQCNIPTCTYTHTMLCTQEHIKNSLIL